MKKKKLLIVGLLGLVALSGCKKPSSSVEAPSEVSSEDVLVETVPAVSGVRTFAGENPAAIKDRKDILTLLESYALDTFIGGIPYRDNSAVVLYSSDLKMPADDYVVGYGFGVGEAEILAPLTGSQVAPERAKYYHTWTSQDPGTINYMDSQESVTGDLHSLISSGYWGTKFNADKTGYEWYPLLANDVERPIPLNFDEATGTATKWRVPLKVGGDLKYNTLGVHSEFAGLEVKLEDYLVPFKLMVETGWFRGTDLASKDSGFVGVAEELQKPVGERSIERVQGIKLNVAEQAMEFEFNSAKSPFYAMYNLASGLFMPIPQSFIDKVGVENYGKADIDNTLSLGVYNLEIWEKDKQVVFKKNPLWIEADRYTHEGYVFTILDDSNTAFQQFLANNLHSAGVPASYLKEYRNDERARQTKGDVTWKLQVNAANQERWNELFGEEGSIAPGGEWELKPVMSNLDFLNGVYYSLNRDHLADTTGSRPAMGFFSEAYMIDPESGVSWRVSEEGQAVLEGRSTETNGFNKEAAGQLFNKAMNDLVAEGKYTRGTAENPTDISLRIHFQTVQQTVDEGGPLKRMIEAAFNDAVEGFKLDIELFATENWMDAYYAMMFGEFDFAFGTIGGNTLDPLSFMLTLCSDNRSGFTLSWGHDTGHTYNSYEVGGLVFKGERYSYDALLESTLGLTIIEEGKTVPSFSLKGLDFGFNEADPTKYDFVAQGTYYVDPAGEYVITPDPDGTKEETGGFLALVFYNSEGEFQSIVPLPATTFENGAWTVVAEGISVPEDAYYMDIYISTIHTYKGIPEYRANLYELLWSSFAPEAPAGE
jgi:hypothetical protein